MWIYVIASLHLLYIGNSQSDSVSTEEFQFSSKSLKFLSTCGCTCAVENETQNQLSVQSAIVFITAITDVKIHKSKIY